MKNNHMGLKIIYSNCVKPRRLINLAKEKGKEDHHTLTDQDELTELVTFQKSLFLFCDSNLKCFLSLN